MSLGVNGGERQWRRGNGDIGLTASGWGKGFTIEFKTPRTKEIRSYTVFYLGIANLTLAIIS